MALKNLSRKQRLKQPDEFITLTGRVIQWVRNNPKRVTAYVAALLAVVLFVAGYSYYREMRGRTASALLSKHLEGYRQASATKKPAQALSAAQPGLEGLAEQYSNQAAGRLAPIYLGHLLLNAAKPSEAIDYYKQMLASHGNDPLLAGVILNGLGAAYYQAGDQESAINYYARLVSGGHTLYKDSALFNLGILYQQTQKSAKAQEMFKQLAELFPDSRYAAMAQEKIAGGE